MTLLTLMGLFSLGVTLPNLEAPEDPALAMTTEESTEEAALLTGGGQEVSLDSISCKEEDNSLSSTLQKSAGENPIEGVSPVESGPSSSTELMGGLPSKGADPPVKPSASIKMTECTATPALTQEHQAKVHSSTIDTVANAVVLTTAHCLPLVVVILSSSLSQ